MERGVGGEEGGVETDCVQELVGEGSTSFCWDHVEKSGSAGMASEKEVREGQEMRI